MASTSRKFSSWLASPRVAAILLLVVGVWSFVGTLVPQGDADTPTVQAWAAANPTAEAFAAPLGLHGAFSSLPFVLVLLLLAASTMVCAWRRTKVASHRSRLLRDISDQDAKQLAQRPTFTVELPEQGAEKPLTTASEALGSMGLIVEERDGVVVAVSRPWAVFASPVFHWALFALILVMFMVQMTRAEGLIGVPVQDARPLAAESFGRLDRGFFYGFKRFPLRIRVDEVHREYIIDGLDRGPAPAVSILRPDGSVAASQVVYPNRPMRYGSLMIHPGEIGLSPGFAIVSKEGTEGARINLIVDLDEGTASGTTAAEFTLTAPVAGGQSILGSVTVPVKQAEGTAEASDSADPKATFVLRPEGGGLVIAEKTLSVGEEIDLPDGSKLRLLGVNNYARLSVVDDPSIPLVYALLAIALVAVSASILGRQSLATVVVSRHDDGTRTVDVWFRDWRANKVRTEQAQEALREALTPVSNVDGDTE
jgi:cytochrome c biogenesis protein ResB